jgi:hypothetical protein
MQRFKKKRSDVHHHDRGHEQDSMLIELIKHHGAGGWKMIV